MMWSEELSSTNSHRMDTFTKYPFNNLVGSSYMIPDPIPMQGKRKNWPRSHRHFVQHNYHDHSRDFSMSSPKETLPEVSESEESSPVPVQNRGRSPRPKKSRRGPRGGVVTPFPEKLHQMLENVDKEGHADIISWQPHGRCFIMHKPKEFVQTLMPKYFRQTKLTSFQRQLNLYGFCRLTSGVDKCGYYHELFLRGKPSLCQKMMRIRIKGTGIKAASNPEKEPNFYSMPPIQPDDSTEDENQTTNSTRVGEMAATISCGGSDESLSDFMVSTTRCASPSTIPKAVSVSPSPNSPTTRISPDMLSFLPPLPLYSPSFSDCERTNKLKLSFQPKSSAHIINLAPAKDDSEAISFEGKKFHYLDSFVHCDYFNSDDQCDSGNKLDHSNMTFPRRRRSVTLDSVFELDTSSSPTIVDSFLSFPIHFSKNDIEEYTDPMLPADFYDLVGMPVDIDEKSESTGSSLD